MKKYFIVLTSFLLSGLVIAIWLLQKFRSGGGTGINLTYITAVLLAFCWGLPVILLKNGNKRKNNK